MDSVRKGGLVLTTTLLILLLALLVGAGSAVATHVSCGDTITRNTTLDSDVICSYEVASALVIGADNIKLDLAGHTVSTQNIGIDNRGHDGVKIENGSVHGDIAAVLLVDASRNQVVNIDASGRITLDRSDENRIDQSVAQAYSGGALGLSDSDRNRISDTVAYGYSARPVNGISLFRSDENRIERTRGFASYVGIMLVDSRSNEIHRSVGSASGFAGIYLIRSDSNLLLDNTAISFGYGYGAQWDTGAAIWIQDSGDNRVAENSAGSSFFDGIHLQNAGATLVQGNSASENGQDGISVDPGSSEVVVRSNTTSKNGDDGIDVETPTTTLTANSANYNGDLGIEAVTGVIDGGGNKAFGNGNPLQCLNVACK